MNGLECIICIRFSKKKKQKTKNKRNPAPPPPPHAKRKKISRIMEIGALKAKITHNFFFLGGGGIRHKLGKNGLRMQHLHPFFKSFLGETPIPPLLREDKNFPSLAFPLQLRLKISRITYIEDRRFESKNYTQFFGEKSTRTRQKWATNAPLASVFQKFSRGDPDPPYCEKIKNSPLWLFLNS